MEKLLDEKNELQLVLDEQDLGLMNAVVEKLLEDKDVTFAAVNYEHPTNRRPLLTAKGKGVAKKLVTAAEQVRKELAEFEDKLGKTLKQ